jgi:zinc transport system permease protein
VTRTEIFFALIVFLTVLATVIILYDDLLAITFDEELARTMGVQTGKINTVLFLLTAVAAVLAMKVAVLCSFRPC